MRRASWIREKVGTGEEPHPDFAEGKWVDPPERLGLPITASKMDGMRTCDDITVRKVVGTTA